MNSQSVQLSRGSLSARTGVNSETIRYYEKIGLMPNPLRSCLLYTSDAADDVSTV